MTIITEHPMPFDLDMLRRATLNESEGEAAARHIEALQGALLAFAAPRATSRVATGENPEDDRVKVEVRSRDWFAACALLGRIDAEYLRTLPAGARPSEEFINAAEDLASFGRAHTTAWLLCRLREAGTEIAVGLGDPSDPQDATCSAVAAFEKAMGYYLQNPDCTPFRRPYFVDEEPEEAPAEELL